MTLRLNTALQGPQAEIFPQSQDPSPSPKPAAWGEKLTQAVQTGLHDLADPVFFGPMMAAQGVFGLSRIGLLKILPQGLSKGGALVVANLSAFGLEGVSFVGSGRGLSHALGRPIHPEADFYKELGHTYLTLGLLKTLGGVTQRGLQLRYKNVPASSLSLHDQLMLKTAPQAGQFLGIYLSHTLAPDLDLGPYLDPADRTFQSAVTLVHFAAAGHMLNRIPGYARANQRIHQATDRLIQERWNRFAPGRLAVTPEGLILSRPSPKPGPNSTLVKMSSSEENGGSDPVPHSPFPSSSLAPPAWGTLSPSPSAPNGNGNGPKTKLKDGVSELGPGVKLLSRLEILTRFSDPKKPPLEIHREPLPAPIQNIEEGRLQAMARGLGERQIWHMRRILDLTRDTPRTRAAYLALERARLDFQQGIRERLDPILKKFQTPSLKSVQDGILEYQKAIGRLLPPETTYYEADALLHLLYANRMLDPEFRTPLTEADLIRMGFEPNATQWARSHGDKYWPGALEALINSHPILSQAPQAEKVLEAAKNFQLEVLHAENLALQGRRLKTTLETYLERVDRGELAIPPEAQEAWERIKKISKGFDPQKIVSPKPREAVAALESGEKLYLELENFRKKANELSPQWADLVAAKDAFPAPTPYLSRGMKNIMGALGRYLKNESVAAVWLSETALHHSLREMLRRQPESFLKDTLLEAELVEVHLLGPVEAARFSERVQHLKTTIEFFEAQKLWADSGRYSNVRGLLDGVARLFGRRDFSDYHRAQGEYERAIQDLLLDFETFLIPAARRALDKRLARVEPQALEELSTKREQLMTRFEEHAQKYRKMFEEMEPEVQTFIDHYDTTMIGLREMGMRVGWTHLNELADKLADSPKAVKSVNEANQKKFDILIQGGPDAARSKPIDPDGDPILIGYIPAAEKAIRGMLNPRDLERNIEEPLKLIMEGYDEVRKAARDQKVDLGEIQPILPMFEPYAFKLELLKELRRRLPFTSHRFDKELPKLGKLNLRDWERGLRMLRYAIPAFGRILRIGTIQHYGYPFAEGSRQFLDFGVRIGRGPNPQTFYNQEGIEDVANYFRFALSADHNVHLDFIGHAGNVVQAMLGQNANRLSLTDIIAKLDLKIPIADTVFPYLTNMIGYQRHQLATAFQRASRMQALGALDHERMIPTMPLGYDNITMDVTNGEGPYVRDPASTVTGSLPVMGRLFGIAEGAAVLTGRPQGMVFTQDPGALRNFPAQRATDRMASMLNNPSTMPTLFIPVSALPTPKGIGKITYRNNLERLIWYLQAFHPQMDLGAPETDALFYRRYRKPLDPETEAVIADLYANAEEIYPSAPSLRRLEASRQELGPEVDRAARTTTPDSVQAFREMGLIHQALDRQTRIFLKNRLTVLDQKLSQELTHHPGIPEAKALRRRQRMIRARLKIMDQVEKKLAQGEALNLTEKTFMAKASAYYSGKKSHAARDPLIDQLEFYFSHRNPMRETNHTQNAHPMATLILGTLETLKGLVAGSRQPFKNEILSLLKSREKKIQTALSHHNLGIPLTPVEQVLLEDLAGAISRENHQGPKDALVSALLETNVTDESMGKILKSEKIRESSRALIEKLPGSGSGTIDPIRESATDVSKVMFDAAGEVAMGPRSHWATAKYAGIFATYASALGALGAMDWLTGGKFDFYTLVSPDIARQAQGMVDWRPVLSARDVRVAEEIRIEAEGLGKGPPRPIALAANHASWTDITTLMAIFPKMRFAFKEELMSIPFLNLALFFGRHQKVSRPINNTHGERERAFRQVQRSGEQMVKTGLSPTFFHSGTRSLTGAPGTPKDGIAHLAIPTNALILAASILGTRRIMGEGGDTFKNGMGTHRKIYIGLDRVDPGEIVDLPAVLANRDSVKVMVKAGKEISGKIHDTITARFLRQLDHLRSQAQEGDLMAKVELAEQMAALEPGMNLIRQGNESEAKAWAKEQKTDYEILKKITQWWDQTATSPE